MHPIELASDAFITKTATEMLVAKRHRDLSRMAYAPHAGAVEKFVTLKPEMPLHVPADFCACREPSRFGCEAIKV
jgi:hypothetical protein